jgi:hypothetical protein
MPPAAYQPMTLAGLARHLEPAATLRRRLLLVTEFCLEYAHEAVENRPALLAEHPALDDERWRTFCEALGEQHAAADGLPAPDWLASTPETLAPWWFPLDAERWEALALATSPMAFRRRGIFIPRSFFESA